ncbi:MAG: hypothetical protein EOO01_40340 [Chitinophagaceae bacterium]|nr:MAG: hypothetical protein EOO01_40340 [Chitinophagaceae bacterium]
MATQDGNHKDFIKAGQFDFGEGLGLRIDEKRTHLWALSNRKDKEWFISQAHLFDKRTGKLKHVFIYRDTVNHFFNDLAIDAKGNAYITATYGGKIFFADLESKKVDVFIDDTLIRYPNGIELYKNKLYIATYGHGPLVYDFNDNSLQQLTGYSDRNIAYNLDGLAVYRNKLLGVYNTDSLQENNAVIAYTLDSGGTNIIKEELIAKGHNEFREPTTMSRSGNKLYVLATSNLNAYNSNKESISGIEQKLLPITVIVYSLKVD